VKEEEQGNDRVSSQNCSPDIELTPGWGTRRSCFEQAMGHDPLNQFSPGIFPPSVPASGPFSESFVVSSSHHVYSRHIVQSLADFELSNGNASMLLPPMVRPDGLDGMVHGVPYPYPPAPVPDGGPHECEALEPAG